MWSVSQNKGFPARSCLGKISSFVFPQRAHFSDCFDKISARDGISPMVRSLIRFILLICLWLRRVLCFVLYLLSFTFTLSGFAFTQSRWVLAWRSLLFLYHSFHCLFLRSRTAGVRPYCLAQLRHHAMRFQSPLAAGLKAWQGWYSVHFEHRFIAYCDGVMLYWEVDMKSPFRVSCPRCSNSGGLFCVDISILAHAKANT